MRNIHVNFDRGAKDGTYFVSEIFAALELRPIHLKNSRMRAKPALISLQALSRCPCIAFCDELTAAQSRF
jgi:hypothetical protein